MPPSDLHDRVERALARDAQLPPGARVVVALSGGGDSVALAVLLCELARTASWTVGGFLHVDHKLRARAGEDAAFCRGLAEEYGVPFLLREVDVAARARAARVSVEEAGHRVRRDAFLDLVAGGEADRVATGHTRDDLAETVLLRMVRGAGPRGLAGIRPTNGPLVRPLLDVRRDELRHFLDARGVKHCEDETNADRRITRNRIRHELMPFLAERFSPGIIDVLAREAAIARADADWIEQAVNDAVARFVQYRDDGARLDATALGPEPPALARRVVQRVLEHVGGRAVGFDHVDRLLDAMHRGAMSFPATDCPGSRVHLRDGMLDVTAARGRGRHHPSSPSFEYVLSVPGAVEVPEVGERLSAAASAPPPALSARGRTVAVQGDRLATPLTVRNWRPGDVIRPLGLGGRKKLQDLFVDRKIAREHRGSIPIVADSTGAIVWVVGQTVADDFRVTEADRGVLILKATKLGGSR